MFPQPNAISVKESRKQVSLSFLMALLILFGTHYPVCSLAAFGLFCMMLLYADNAFVISLMFFIMPMAGIFKLSPESTSLFTYVELLYVVLHIYRKKFRVTYGELLALFFFGYIAITGSLYTSLNVIRTVKIVANLMLMSYIAELDFEREHKRLFLSFVFGIIVSSLISMANTDFFPVAEYVTAKATRFEGELIGRFAGLYEDPNYYSVNVIIAMCLIIMLYKRKELSFPTTVWLQVLMVVFVGMTGSRSSFLMLFLPALLIVYVCVKNRNYIALAASFLLLCTTVLLVNQGEIQLFEFVLQRLESVNLSTGSFTNSRTLIWDSYMQFFREQPVRTLVGTGASIHTLNNRAAHNTYIDLIYQFGVIGTVLYLISLYYCVRKTKRRIRRNLSNGCVFATIAVMYFFLSELLYIDLPFHIVLGCIAWNLEPGISSTEQK